MGKSFVVSFQKGSLIEGVEAELEPETVLMNCRELVVDTKVFYKNLRKLEREFDDAEMSLRNKSPESFNPNSTKQCRDIILDEGYPVLQRTANGAVSIAKEVLAAYANMGSDFAKSLITYREAKAKLSQMGSWKDAVEEGCVRPVWDQ